MATLSHAESRRSYSWWWDSHISPKNSKWLQENLTDMDAKVKAMIKLIEEDADSFARRAEMYYKKRPELMKLVEEFYRAYRALAERYDHATGELRQAHRTMAEAFPNQIPFALTDDSPSGSSVTESEPRTPEMPHPIRAFFDPDHDELQKDVVGLSSHFHVIKRNGAYADDGDAAGRKGLKQLSDLLGPAEGADHVNLGEGRARKGLNFREEEGTGSENKVSNVSKDLHKHEAEYQENSERKLRSFQDEISKLSTENQNLKARLISESGRADKAEAEVESQQKALSMLQAEKEVALHQYQQCLERVSNLEGEICHGQDDIDRLNGEISKLSLENHNLGKRVMSESERACNAEAKVEDLYRSLSTLQAEKEATLCEYQQCLERMSNLEIEISLAKEDVSRLNGVTSKLSAENENLETRVVSETLRAGKAGVEIESLQKALSTVQAGKEAALYQYQQRSEMVSALEAEIACEQDNINRLHDDISKLSFENQNLEMRIISEIECTGRAEAEVARLQEALSELEAEKKTALHEYHLCLKKVSELEAEISQRQGDVNRLNSEMQAATMRLSGAEEHSLLLEQTIRSLQSEVGNLTQTVMMQQQELARKNEELEKLSIGIQEERAYLMQAKASLQSLQDLHSQSQEKHRVLALELQHEVQMLKGMELTKQGLEEDIQRIKKENDSLSEQNLSSALSIKNLQDEILSLNEANGKLEEKVGLHINERNVLQQEVFCLKEEINDLGQKHSSVIEQVESVGLNVESFQSFVKDLQDENSNLKQIGKKNEDEKVSLLKKLEDMEKLLEKNALLENSLSDVNAELEASRDKLKSLAQSLQSFQAEKSTLVAEKNVLISQVESLTQNVEKLMEKNSFFENSLYDSNVELEVLREKSKCLEEYCQSVQNEKSSIIAERDSLVAQVESTRRSLEDIEKRHADLEVECLGLEKERVSILHYTGELQASLDLEKQEHQSYIRLTKSQLAALGSQTCCLQEEVQRREKELEEERDNVATAQVEIFVLQSCIGDLKERQQALLIQCQENLEAFMHAKKLISELEEENHGHHAKVKSLLENEKKARIGIDQVLMSLDIDIDGLPDAHFVPIVEKIKGLQSSILDAEDEKQRLLFEKSVIVALLEQLKLEGLNLSSEKHALEQESEIRIKELLMLQGEKHVLMEDNKRLRQDVQASSDRIQLLQDEMERMLEKNKKLQAGIHQVLESLDIDLHGGFPDEYFALIQEKIKGMQCSILDAEDEKQQLLFEKSIIVTLLGQLKLAAVELRSEKHALVEESAIRSNELMKLQGEKCELLEVNEGLREDVQVGHRSIELLGAEMEIMHGQLSNSHEAHMASQSENCKLLEENQSLLKELCCLREEINKLEAENDSILREAMLLDNLSLVFEGISSEKAMELEVLYGDLDHLHALGNDLKAIRVMAETLQAENSHLKNSVEKMEEIRNRSMTLEDELSTMRKESEQLNHQLVVVKDLLDQKEMELSQAYLKLRVMQSKITDLVEEIAELRIREENLNSQLKEKAEEAELWEAEAAEFYADLQSSAIHAVLFEEKAHELIRSFESLEESAILQTKAFNDEIVSRKAHIRETKEKVSVLERENERMRAELMAYLPLIGCLKESVSSLEDCSLPSTRNHITDGQEAQGASTASHEDGMSGQELNEAPEAAVPGVLELQNLQAKLQAVEKAVMEKESLAMQENSDLNIKVVAALKEIEGLKLKKSRVQEEALTSKDIIIEVEQERAGSNEDVELQKSEKEASSSKNGLILKDIQLDHVSDSSSHDNGVGSYRRGSRGNADSDDQMLELWETAEQDCSHESAVIKPPKVKSTANDNAIECLQIEALEEQKSEYPSSELQAEDLAIDKLEVPKQTTDPHQEGNKKILERLASDARRLMNLQTSIIELKKKTESLDKKKQLASVEYDNIRGQIIEVEEAVSQLVDINGKLTKKTEDASASLESEAESQETRNIGNRQFSLRARKWSEKIGRLELEVQRIQFVLLKLEDECKSKGSKTVERRTRVLLSDYLYGRKEKHGRKKLHCCACIRPSTRDD